MLGERGDHRLHTATIGGSDLENEKNVPALAQHSRVIAPQHCLPLRFHEGPFIEIGAFITQEAFAVCRLHKRHAELIKIVAAPAKGAGKNHCARNIVKYAHCRPRTHLMGSHYIHLGSHLQVVYWKTTVRTPLSNTRCCAC